MRKLRIFLACLVCRLARWGIRLLGRGGTAMPGTLALKICPSLLADLGRSVESVVLTGTNGKTTTAGMLRRMLDEQGVSYVSNRSGANLTNGIAVEFVENASLWGKPRARLAVIECDEGNVPAVMQALKPRAMVVTNLFRDQLDRYGEVTHTRELIAKGIALSPDTTLCLNADCSLTASLGEGVENPVIFYGVDGVSTDEVPTVSDAPRCLRCGERYAYHRHTFAHLGDWYCPHCGEHRPTPELRAEKIESIPGGSRMILLSPQGSREVVLGLPALYNVYNALAALTAARAMGWDPGRCAGALRDFNAMFGRMETMEVGGTPVQIVLVKNPAGCDRALEYLSSVEGDYLPIFCLNDNAPDGTDVSWIWDADYEGLFRKRTFSHIGVWGIRAQDMRLRLKYAGADDGSIQVYASVEELAQAVVNAGQPVYVLPNYTSMLTVRDKLSNLAGGGKFWE